MTDNDRPKGPDEPTTPGGGPPVGEPERRRGSMSFQDPHSTTPREPTLAERRSRELAVRRQREEELAAQEEAERKAKKRKRILIGGGVTVGVVAVVAVIYAASTPDEVTAHCVDQGGVVVDEEYCDENYARGHGGYVSGGFIYIGGTSYRYNYGGSGVKGQAISGGSYVAPSADTPVKTASGKPVQRGGLGVGGGKSGGS